MRRQMIAQSSAFLSWAMLRPRPHLRIPRRKLSEGGFQPLMRQPGGKQAVARWWLKFLSDAESKS